MAFDLLLSTCHAGRDLPSDIRRLGGLTDLLGGRHVVLNIGACSRQRETPKHKANGMAGEMAGSAIHLGRRFQHDTIPRGHLTGCNGTAFFTTFTFTSSTRAWRPSKPRRSSRRPARIHFPILRRVPYSTTNFVKSAAHPATTWKLLVATWSSDVEPTAIGMMDLERVRQLKQPTGSYNRNMPCKKQSIRRPQSDITTQTHHHHHLHFRHGQVFQQPEVSCHCWRGTLRRRFPKHLHRPRRSNHRIPLLR